MITAPPQSSHKLRPQLRPRKLIGGLLLRLLLWSGLLLVLWLALRQAPLAEAWAALQQLGLWQVTALVSANLLITLLFSSRWWLILRAVGYRVPYLTLAGYRLAGFAISYFTPGTQFGGEPLQVYLLEKRQGIPMATALASVTLDKLFEILANFTFLIMGVFFLVQSGALYGGDSLPANPSPLLWSGLLLAIPLFYLLTLASGRFPLTWLLTRFWGKRVFDATEDTGSLPGFSSKKLHRLWQKIPPLVASTEGQIARLFRQHPLTMLWVLLFSGLIWLLSVLEYWLTLYFLGAHLDLTQAISALTTARLAFLTPIPGGLGALEAGQAFILQAFGYPAALGLSLSLVIRVRDTFLGLCGLGWGAILARQKSDQPLLQQAGD